MRSRLLKYRMSFEGFVQISSLQLSTFLTLDKLLTLYEPQFLCVSNGVRSPAEFLGQLQVLSTEQALRPFLRGRIKFVWVLVLLEVLQNLNLRSGGSHGAILSPVSTSNVCILANSPTILYLLNHWCEYIFQWNQHCMFSRNTSQQNPILLSCQFNCHIARRFHFKSDCFKVARNV